jgi:hypothetical protein
MSIARFTTAFALSLLASQLALGDEPTCAAKKGATHTLKFKVKDDGCVEKVKKDSDGADADTLNVCETDTVVWKVSGKPKAIVFDGTSPFEWLDSGYKDSEIQGTVKAGTAGKDPFKYSVKVVKDDGKTCVLDPKIIVDP